MRIKGLLIIALTCLVFAAPDLTAGSASPASDPADLKRNVAEHIACTYHATADTTEAVSYLSDVPILFFTFEAGRGRRYGFGWKEKGTFHCTVLPDNPVCEKFTDLSNAGGELITRLSVKALICGQAPLISVHRADSWQAWYVLFLKVGTSFRPVWAVSPWTSVKGAFTEANTFDFRDTDGDGDYEIVNDVERCEDCWSEKPSITRSRELYKWNGTEYRLVH